MSVIASNASAERRGAASRDPGLLRLLEVLTTAAAAVALLAVLLLHRVTFSRELTDVAIWLPLVILADLMPVSLWQQIEVTMSLPVLLAAAMIFSPAVAFALGFVGYTDHRELRRRIPFLRGLFNRSNVGVSVLAASLVFHTSGGSLHSWPAAIGFGFLALIVDVVLNNGLMLIGACLLFQRGFRDVWRDVYGRTWPQFVFGYACFGWMAILLASVYLFAGNWGLAVFMIPMFLSHEMFSNWTALRRVAARLRHQEKAFASVSERIADERREERLTIAADLHDEVLPPLFKVHLMGQVIRQDLASGRLLELDDDLPGLLTAADAANDAIRVLIRDLRRSSLGIRGLRGTLAMLARRVEADFGVRVETRLDEVSAHPVSELLAYQVAREAIRNSVKYAERSDIHVSLMRGEGDFRLIVRDAGPGFEVDRVDPDQHFGLQLMRERVELCGGTIVIDSHPGAGTTVAVRFPLAYPANEGK